jgi:hypothetical protein
MRSIYVREKNNQGKWKPRRIKEGRGVKTGDLVGPFYIRPFINGKQGWRPLQAQTFQEAKTEAELARNALDAHGKGLTVAEAASLTGNRTTVRAAIDAYLEQASSKAPKTVAQYKTALEEFFDAIEGVNIRFNHDLPGHHRQRETAQQY